MSAFAFDEVGKIIASVNWNDDSFDLKKSYIMALFSELAYFHLAKRENGRVRRFRVVPCEAWQELAVRGERPNVAKLFEAYDGLRSEGEGPGVAVIEGTYIIALIFRLSRFVVVAFRGTQDFYDWRVNLDTTTERDPWGRMRVHRGFMREFFRHAEQIGGELEAIRRGAQQVPLYLTGHSLGGAIASIASLLQQSRHPIYVHSTPAWMAFHKFDFKLPYSFGAPRFADLFANTQTSGYHTTIDEDIVPYVPPLSFGYEDPLHRLNPDGTRKNARSKTLSYTRWILSLASGSGISAHSMTGYRLRIAAHLDISSPTQLIDIEKLK